MTAVLHAAFEEYRPYYTDAAFDATVLDAERIRERLRGGPAWLAFDDDVPVATVSARRTAGGVYMRSLAVIASARGCGIGTALVERIERFAFAACAARVFLSTTPFLHEAIALYERCGFVRCPDPPHVLHGTPLFTMEKSLAGRAAKAPRSKT